jgi:predicted Ser/Thr protein kinase
MTSIAETGALPSQIGRYRILGWLGSGGMGEVLAGHDAKLDRPVAIKRIRADKVTDERRQRLEFEARLNARLSHPNVVQVYDFVSDDAGDHIVSEYVDGESLADLCREERLSVERAIAILADVARGLDAAHRSGILHRDLKLENVLVSRDGQTKIADFGIAVLRVEDDHSDMRAFGALAYELLTGAPVAKRRPLREVAPAIPAALAKLVDRLLDDTLSAHEAAGALDALAVAPSRRAHGTQFRQIAVLSLHAPSPTGAIEHVAARIAEWHRRVREVAGRFQAHTIAGTGLEALVCVGYPRVYGDNCLAAANLVAELDGVGLAAGIDASRVAIVDEVIAGPAIDGALGAARRAAAGTVLVTPAAQRQLSRSFRLSPVEAEGSPLYRLGQPLDWNATAASPLVGRDDVLARLREEELRGGALVMVGPPGIGKSRLLRAFVGETSAVRVVFARGTEQTRSSAFASFQRLLHDLPEVGRSRDAVDVCVAELASGSRAMAAVVAHVAGVSTQADERILAEAAPYERHSFVAEELARFLVEVLASHPSLLVVDDLHWLDTSSLDVLDAMVRARATSLFILATTRPRDVSLPQMELSPLEAADSARLVDGIAALPPPVVQAIVSRAAGIPLVLEELAHFAAAGSTPDVTAIPTTYADAILERFQDLAARTRDVGQVASSIGQEIDESLLAAACGLPVGELRTHVDLLAREGLLHVASFGERRSYAFRHALTREAIYDAQDSAIRLSHHCAILGQIDALFPEWNESRADIVARQSLGAGDVRRAIRAWTVAGSRAVAQWSHAVAVQHFEAALSAIGPAGQAMESGADWASAAELELRRAYAPALTRLTNWCSPPVNANNARIRELATTAKTGFDWTATFTELTQDYALGRVDGMSEKLGWLAAEADSPLNRFLLASMEGVLKVHSGYLVRARKALSRSLELREPLMPVLRQVPYAEPMVIPRLYLAWVEFLEGNIVAAWATQREEEDSFEPGTSAHVTACSFGAALAMTAHAWEEARTRATLVAASPVVASAHIALAEMHLAVLDLHRATTDADVERHLAAARKGYDGWQGGMMRVCVPLYLAELAEGCLIAARRVPSALRHAESFVDRMLAAAAESNMLDRYLVSEVHRIHAELLEMKGLHAEAGRARAEARRCARALESGVLGKPLFLEARIDG